jgi:hypothetical protein
MINKRKMESKHQNMLIRVNPIQGQQNNKDKISHNYVAKIAM